MKNLPPVFNSTLRNCFLMQVYFSSDRKRYGFEKLLRRAFPELRELVDCGIEVSIGGQNKRLKVVLGQISGDNLGMHGLFFLDLQKVSWQTFLVDFVKFIVMILLISSQKFII